MKTRLASFAIFSLGGGEIILILIALFVFGLLALGAFGLVYALVRAGQRRPPRLAPALPPQIIQELPSRDLEHIRLLAIFHFALAGLALMGCAFLGFHYFMMQSIFSNPGFWRSHPGGQPPPPEFLKLFVWFYIVGGLVLGVSLLLNLTSGLFLLKRRQRLFSLIVAGLDCLHVPFGTTLGIFTFIVLSRDSVRELYRLSQVQLGAPAGREQ